MSVDARGLGLFLTVAGPEFRLARGRLPLYGPSDPRGRWVRSAQSYRGGSPEIARLLAWIDAVAAHDDWDQILAAVESADRREQGRAEGHYTEAARLLAEEAAPELRAAFVREDCLEIILGYWDVDLGWHKGMAGLSSQECMATTLSLSGKQPWEIARSNEMLSRRRQRAGDVLAVKTVDNLLILAANKLQVLFGQPPSPDALLQREPKGEAAGGPAGGWAGYVIDEEEAFGPAALEDEENPDPELFNP